MSERECKQIWAHTGTYGAFLGRSIRINDLKYVLLYWVRGAHFRDLCICTCICMCVQYICVRMYILFSFFFIWFRITHQNRASFIFEHPKRTVNAHTLREATIYQWFIWYEHIHLTLLLRIQNILSRTRFFSPISLAFYSTLPSHSLSFIVHLSVDDFIVCFFFL